MIHFCHTEVSFYAWPCYCFVQGYGAHLVEPDDLNLPASSDFDLYPTGLVAGVFEYCHPVWAERRCHQDQPPSSVLPWRDQLPFVVESEGEGWGFLELRVRVGQCL